MKVFAQQCKKHGKRKKEKHGTNHISEEKLDVCWRHAGRHAGGSVRGTDLGVLGDKESIVGWLPLRGSLVTSRPGKSCPYGWEGSNSVLSLNAAPDRSLNSSLWFLDNSRSCKKNFFLS
jgi:hypothetical protein